MEKVKIYNIDDDNIDIEKTKKIISLLPNLEYLGSSNVPLEGLEEVIELKPDILLLDVEMPEYNGLEIAHLLKGKSNCHIVFLTSHTGYAVDAFNVFALHYLLKPLKLQDLENVIERFTAIKNNYLTTQMDQISELLKNFSPTPNIPNKIFVNMHKEIAVIPMSNIVYLEASGAYTHIHVANGPKIISSKLLKVYADTFEKNPEFKRIHRSYIINKSYLKSIIKKNLKIEIVFTNNESIEIGKLKNDDWYDTELIN